VERRIRERMVNILLVMYTIKKVAQFGVMDGTVKLQKIVFLAQKELLARKLKGFSYNFFRWNHGPYSADLANDYALLEGSRFAGGWPIRLNKDGEQVLAGCRDLLESNRAITEVIDSVAERYANLPSDELKQAVYDMTITVPRLKSRVKIGDIRHGQLILFRPRDEAVKGIFRLSPGWMATLETVFDSDMLESLAEAQEDAAEGRAREFKALKCGPLPPRISRA